MQTVCVDRGRQWSRATNIWHNAGIRSGIYMTAAPSAWSPGRSAGAAEGLPDAVVVGAGPNGLAAAIELARAGRSVLVFERAGDDRRRGANRRADAARATGTTSARRSIRSRVGSPFLRTLPLADHGLELDRAATCRPPIRSTAAARPSCTGRSTRRRPGSGRDGDAYTALMRPFATAGTSSRRSCSARRGRPATRCSPPGSRGPAFAARPAWRAPRFRSDAAPRAAWRDGGALDAAARSRRRRPASRSCSLALGHAVGWPVARGGSQAIADAMARLPALARRRDPRPAARCGRWPTSRRPGAVLLRRDARASSLAICGGRAAAAATPAALGRYRYGPGVFKVDYALDGPVPWTAEAVAGRGTVHVGGDAGRDRGRRGAPSRAAATRAPVRARRPAEPRRSRPRAGGPPHAVGVLPRAERLDGRHDGARSSAQIERFAPGLPRRSCSRARRAARPTLEARQPELRRRRHQRRRRRPAPGARPAGAARAAPYATPEPAHLPVLVVDPARRRRPRHVRLPRRPRGAGQRPAVDGGA